MNLQNWEKQTGRNKILFYSKSVKNMIQSVFFNAVIDLNFRELFSN